ncbi:MAG: 5-formyltetrahydrofolate cyclo-ligase [Clostridia bacterium]|nr:5-formyltetrahydrofolate cyclo-ligase [Clostridia bacterium]
MKNLIRKQNKEKRALMTKTEVEEKSKKAASYFLESEIYKNSHVLMLYMPLGNETDTRYIINNAYRDGKKVVFPVTDEKSGEITPFYADENTNFKKGAFCVNEPLCADIADPTDIDLVLVPGIAFDRTGMRVGFGKGCYDGFLKKLSAVKVGYCYNFQLTDKIESEAHDISMDFIVTESGIIKVIV